MTGNYYVGILIALFSLRYEVESELDEPVMKELVVKLGNKLHKVKVNFAYSGLKVSYGKYHFV